MAREIWSYGSNSISCVYTISMKRSGSTVTVTASGTIYGNGSSQDNSHDLYAHVAYNVSPANQTGTTTYSSSFGGTFGTGVKIVPKPLNSSSIPKSGKSFTASWSFTNNAAVSYSNCALFLTKSSSLSLSSIFSAYEFIGKKGNLNVNKVRYYTETLSVGAGYTANSAPTSITASKNITAPGTVTISWSGAKAGTNNSIASYTLYYTRSTNGAAPTTSSYTDRITNITGTSYDVSYSSNTAYRGYYYVYKVVAESGVSNSYDSSISSASASVKINTKPPAPTVNLNYSQVPSTGGSVKATTLSSTDSDGQTTTFYYATSASGTKTKLTTSTSLSVGSSGQTFYFWAYDGLEYSSSYTTKTVTAVSKPTVSISVTGIGTEYSTADSTYYTSYEISATPSAGTGKYRFYYKVEGDSNWTEFSSGTYYSSNSYTISDITAYCPAGKSIAFDVGYYQSIDYSTYNDSAWVVSDNYKIPAMPTLGNIYNQQEAANLDNSDENYFLNKIRTYFSKDTGITSVVTSIKSSVSNETPTLTSSNTFSSSNSPYINLTTDSTSYGTSYTFTIVLKRGNSHSKTYSFSKTKVRKVNFGDLTLSNYVMRPHLNQETVDNFFNDNTLGNDSNIIIQFPNLMDFDGISDDILKQYGLYMSDNTINGLILQGTCNGITYNFPESNYYFIPKSENDDSYLQLSINTSFLKELYEQGTTFNIKDFNGTENFTFSIATTTIYNENYSTSAPNLLIDFDVPIEKLTHSLKVEYLNKTNGNDKYKEINNGTLIRKKDFIQYTFNWQSYNTYDIDFTGYIKRVDNTEEKFEEGSWVNYSQTLTETLNRQDSMGDIITGTYIIEVPVNTISNSSYLYFKGLISQNYSETQVNWESLDSTLSNTNYGISVKHDTAIITISNGSYSDTDKSEGAEGEELSFRYLNSDVGLSTINRTTNGFSAQAYIQYSDNENFENLIELSLDEYGYDYNKFIEYPSDLISYKGSIWEESLANFYYVRLKLVTKDDGEFFETSEEEEKTNTVTSYSNYLIIYNITPTLSYRKNCLGINYKMAVEIEEDEQQINTFPKAIMIIGETTGKNKIYYSGPEDSLGEMIGFYFSGGSWD